ncbi:general secretion pathway protein [Pigmentiphaga sp.]|uniref:general secretion pathway protein n=1 Tax=Pigmentiphaga sp. TaxID=1977564 RepID=UPI0025EBBE70|nr:general secretion pathway protein [Pigmentiphaga sp.]
MSTLRERARVAWCAARFRAGRADYYDYLADVMEASGGRKTLRDIFLDDARRYAGHARGMLSAHWAMRYQNAGGDLHETLRSTLPDDDLSLLRMAQRGGAGALEQTLRDVAAVTRLADEARRTLAATLSAALAAVLVSFGMIVAVPLFTVPRLKRAFGAVPDEFLGNLTRRLYAFAELIHGNLFVSVLALGLVVYFTGWSLPNLTGRVRRVLDRHFIWRLYRDLQGIRFLASLAAMVKRRGNVSTALREALELQVEGANPWRRWHLERMIANIDDGRVGSATFDTGIVEPETLWFLDDLIAARGMDRALQQTRARLEERSLRQVARRALAARWVLLLAAVGVALSLVFWHVGVVNEMRSALTNYYSSR